MKNKSCSVNEGLVCLYPRCRMRLSSLVEMLSWRRSGGAGKRVRHQTGTGEQQLGLGLAGPQGADSQTLTEEEWEVNYARAQVMVKAAGMIFHLSVCLARLVNTGGQRQKRWGSGEMHTDELSGCGRGHCPQRLFLKGTLALLRGVLFTQLAQLAC